VTLKGAEELTEIFITSLQTDFLPKLKAWLFSTGYWRLSNWIIAADFSFDTATPYKCMAFSLMPMFPDIDVVMKNIDTNLPKDIKRSSEITESSLQWFRALPAMHFALLLEKGVNVVAQGREGEMNLRREMPRAIQRARKGGRDKDHVGSLNLLRQKMTSRGFNFTFLSDIQLLAACFSVLEATLRSSAKCRGVLFSPDRDNMTTAYNGVFKVLLSELRAVMAEKNGFDDENYLFGLTVTGPDSLGKGAWFDSLIRIPDWIAGALSVVNPRDIQPIRAHSKVSTILENVLGSAQNFSALLLEDVDDGYRFSVMKLEKGKRPVEGESEA
jgi:hypothetical protein